MPTIKQKRLRPIDQNVHLKYRCPKCSSDHWISMKEAQTKGYRIVCDCNEILRVKLVEKNEIIYSQAQKKSSLPEEPEKKKETIPLDLLTQSCTILLGYGFDISEAEKLIVSTFDKTPTYICVDLIKQALKNFGEKNG